MASKINYERANIRAKVARSTPDFARNYAPAATGITCGCGLDLAHFGSRIRFKAHRDQCSPLPAAA